MSKSLFSLAVDLGEGHHRLRLRRLWRLSDSGLRESSLHGLGLWTSGVRLRVAQTHPQKGSIIYILNTHHNHKGSVGGHLRGPGV